LEGDEETNLKEFKRGVREGIIEVDL